MKNPTIALAALAAVSAAALLAGCASKVDLNEAPVESRTPTPVAGSGNPALASQTPGTGGPASRVATVTTPDPAAQALAAANAAGRIVYFDFDSFVIKDEFKPLIDAHSKALAASRARKLSIEGHADERGGREYNLALGQKRAEAVARSLVLLGTREEQVEAVSFGKERPAVEGHDEAAWAKNRRAELKDRK
jgi:peptidoglycan-associated lipoprotein